MNVREVVLPLVVSMYVLGHVAQYNLLLWRRCIHIRVHLSITLPVVAIELLAEWRKANPVNMREL